MAKGFPQYQPARFPQPAFEESARIIRNPKPARFVVTLRPGKNSPDENFLSVETKTVEFYFRDRDVQVKKSSEVRLFSSVGVSLIGKPDVFFRLESRSGFSPRTTPESADYFTYGGGLFYVDHETRLVKVWARWFWYDVGKNYLGFGLVEPMPPAVQPKKGLPAVKL